ncbi:hypothetical protein A7K91_12550 [Paenibacillus oryzae]|uniref:Glycosyl transferase family 2 n=1 Tax=Paenibacillus oryzae TaxID=1844972 RepID=A0A1A5YFH0_9BACL|nr:glycosyltransferase [Paenibacillus oryzae]OBR64339.1 hypothetical protein A7K91_12550 [Paenibacillus oryzae]
MTSKFNFHIDKIIAFDCGRTAKVVMIEGWYYYKQSKGDNITIQYNENDIFEINSFINRIDVREHIGEEDALKSGFSVCLLLPSNQGYISLVDKINKQFLMNIDIRTIEYSFENVFEFFVEDVYIDYAHSNRGKKRVAIEGWAFSKINNISSCKLIVRKEKMSQVINHGEAREDVHDVHCNYPDSLTSGFVGEVLIKRDKGTLSLIIQINGVDFPLVNYNVEELPKKNKVEQEHVTTRLKSYYYFVNKIMKKAWFIYSKKHKYRLSLSELIMYSHKAKAYFMNEMNKTIRHASSGFQKNDPYAVWIQNNSLSKKLTKLLIEEQRNFTYRPLISIVMPVYNVKVEWLEKAILSIENQIYDNWELCIADDCSTMNETIDYLKQYQESNKVKIHFRNINGNISEASNTAASLASGEFILLMDNDDELAPNALFEMVSLLQENRNIDIFYSDDDKIDENGVRYAPQFKPDWSPELLLTYMYISHLFCFRRELFNQIGGFRIGFEGTQDYDLALRITELTDRIVHIPKILYHWRAIEGSTALNANAKPEAFQRAERAIDQALQRRGVNGKAYWPDFAKKGALGMFALQFPDVGPNVTIIIPTKNQYKILKRCIDSLELTTYKDYEVLIIDNESDELETIEYLSTLSHRVLKISNENNKFSYARINNEAVKQVSTKYILFLNNDTEVINPDWLSRMMGYQLLHGVGAVGARLLYPDKRVQHAGVVIGYHDGLAGHAFKLTGDWDLGYLGYSRSARNYSAVTAACLLTSKEDFMSVGGFNEQEFAVAYNDVDYCLNLINEGKRIVYVPDALLYHHESLSRGNVDNPQEILNFKEKYKYYKDPYYNINLSLKNENFQFDTSSTLKYDNILPKVKLLMACFNLNFEGAPTMQFQLVKGLIERENVEIEIFCPQDGPLRNSYEQLGIKIHIFEHPIKHVYTIKEYETSMDKFSEWILENNYDVVYANTLQTFYVIEAARKAGIPSIWNIHESADLVSYFDFLPAQINEIASRTIAYPYRNVFVSNATADLFEKYNINDSFDIVHNGLMLEEIENYCHKVTKEEARKNLNISDDEVVFLIVGTVCERKGQIDFVKAANQVMNTNTIRTNTKFIIVGGRSSPYQEEVMKQINNGGFSDRIHMVMETSQVGKYYRAADIFVCCSYNESYPMVILEAMAYGLPIITTSVFGIKEQVSSDINAFVFKEGDINSLASRMEIMIKDPAIRRRMAYNSQLVLRGLESYDDMVLKYERIILDAGQVGI